MHIHSSSFLFILIALCGLSACRVQPPTSNSRPFTKDSIALYLQKAQQDPMTHILNSYETSSYNYLVPYYLSRHANIDSANQAAYFGYRTMLTTFSSFVGDVKENESSYINSRHSETEILEDSNYTALDAVDEIASIAQKNSVIMFNESHIDPRGRLFLTNLLPTLKAAGFTYLFLEGLREDDINERGFPLQTSGFYTCEPMFGNLLRKAIQHGFKLVPYDYYPDQKTVPEREQHQAKTIYETLQQHPGAKAIVFAGHGHINKDPEINWMAHRFKTLSGIDPFCINQSINSEAPQLFNHLRKHIDKATIYKNLNTNIYREFSKVNLVDATIVFPNTQWMDNQYADWLLQSGTATYTINLSGEHYEGALLSISKCNEFDQFGILAVPVLNIILQKTTHQNISLDQGSYYLRVTDLYGKELYKEKITL